VYAAYGAPVLAQLQAEEAARRKAAAAARGRRQKRTHAHRRPG
jgi:hypothetical protein